MDKELNIKIGDVVKLKGKHPFSGHTGQIIAIQTVMGKKRPRVRLYDHGDHEVFVMSGNEMQVLK